MKKGGYLIGLGSMDAVSQHAREKGQCPLGDEGKRLVVWFFFFSAQGGKMREQYTR